MPTLKASMVFTGKRTSWAQIMIYCMKTELPSVKCSQGQTVGTWTVKITAVSSPIPFNKYVLHREWGRESKESVTDGVGDREEPGYPSMSAGSIQEAQKDHLVSVDWLTASINLYVHAASAVERVLTLPLCFSTHITVPLSPSFSLTPSLLLLAEINGLQLCYFVNTYVFQREPTRVKIYLSVCSAASLWKNDDLSTSFCQRQASLLSH